MKKRLRPALAVLLLGIFLYLGAGLAPYFIRNFRFARELAVITRSGKISAQPPERLRAQIMELARQQGIPIKEEDVLLEIAPAQDRITVRYRVEVKLPGYTVYLHFAPQAGR
ncbi:MAG: hypothetical protein HY236_06560 [Acidobacteria bacterium]|nr:hypothetical protein [Acidobacteriota bacterium]